MLKILFKLLKWVAFAIIWRIVVGVIKRKVKRFLHI